MTVYRGRSITSEEIVFIRQLIADHPELSRWKLSRQLCEAWQWKQANGALRDMVCRGLLLMLHRAGAIQLPPVRRWVRNHLAERERPEPVIPDKRPVHGPLGSPCQKSWQAEARPTWCRKLLIRRRGAGAFACEPGVTRLLTWAARQHHSA
jgi:hypothetical protein